MTYTIRSTDGTQDETTTTIREARRIARRRLGADRLYLSHSYRTGCGHVEAVSCYGSRSERDADTSATHGTRIVTGACVDCDGSY